MAGERGAGIYFNCDLAAKQIHHRSVLSIDTDAQHPLFNRLFHMLDWELRRLYFSFWNVVQLHLPKQGVWLISPHGESGWSRITGNLVDLPSQGVWLISLTRRVWLISSHMDSRCTSPQGEYGWPPHTGSLVDLPTQGVQLQLPKQGVQLHIPTWEFGWSPNSGVLCLATQLKMITATVSAHHSFNI